MDLREECLGAKKIGISGHIRPDGDCVGVCLSLQMYLRKLLPEAEVTVYLQKPSEEFSYLKGYDEIQTECPVQEPFDVYFALDCSGDRLGGAETYFQNAKKKINIDHHISNSGCGDVNLVRPEVGSTCEVLYHIMDVELIGRDIAEALYTGIIHDTNVFKNSNTTAKTMEVAGVMMEKGINFSQIIDGSFYKKTYVQNQIMGRAVLESVLFLDGKCIFSVVRKQDMDFYGVEASDLDGIVDQLRVTDGVEVAIFLHETENHVYKVSMRSNNLVNVSQVAAYFGGGGHARAAGFSMTATPHDIINNLARRLELQFNSGSEAE